MQSAYDEYMYLAIRIVISEVCPFPIRGFSEERYGTRKKNEVPPGEIPN